MRLRGRVALITGAANGIGHAVAELYFKKGAIVIASDLASSKPAYSAGINALKLDAQSGGFPAQ